MPVREVLAAMREAGVTSLPGGGAEVFSPAARATIADKKLSGDEWLAVHREAHRLGIPSNCTMLYGHVETMADRVDHLLALRALQDETGGFLCYIPLAYHPDHNKLGEALGRSGTATTGCDDLKNIAVGRDRKSTRLNSSHGYISYAVFCLKKKKKNKDNTCNSD